MPLERRKLEDGRDLYVFHQSDLKDFSMCNERARPDDRPEAAKWEMTDASATGTSLHSGIEMALHETLAFGQASYDVAEQVMLESWEDFCRDPRMRWIQSRPDQAGNIEAFLVRALHSFWSDLLPMLEPALIEHTFEVVLLEDEEKVIRLKGTIDYVDRNLGLIDWKTSNQDWQPWEHQRWDVQPTAYTYAAWQGGLPLGDDLGDPYEGGVVPFTFAVWKKPTGVLDVIEVYRDSGDWSWLQLRARNIVTLLEKDLPYWPVNDAGWHCSEKWCPKWSVCKGRFVSVDYPRKAERWK